MGDGRLAHAKGVLQAADRELPLPKQGAEQAHPGEVSQHLQKLARLSDLLRGWEPWVGCRTGGALLMKLSHGTIIDR